MEYRKSFLFKSIIEYFTGLFNWAIEGFNVIIMSALKWVIFVW